MKINKVKNNKNKKTTLVVVSLILLVIISGVVYATSQGFFNQKSNSKATINLGPATDEEKKEGNNTKSSTVNPEDASSGSTKNTDPHSQPPTPSTVSVQTSVSSQNGTTYQLRYLIESVLNGATCTLTLKNGSIVVTKTSKTQALPQSSTCQGFDIPTSELNPGTWEMTLVVAGENVTGSTSSTIKVQ